MRRLKYSFTRVYAQTLYSLYTDSLVSSYPRLETAEITNTNEYCCKGPVNARTHAFTDTGPMGGAQGSNVAVRSPDGTNSLIGRPCLLTDRRRNRANRAGAGCSWLGRRSAGAYARTLRTPTLLKRAKPCAPPTFSSLPLPPTFHLVYRIQRRIVYTACVVRLVET